MAKPLEHRIEEVTAQGHGLSSLLGRLRRWIEVRLLGGNEVDEDWRNLLRNSAIFLLGSMFPLLPQIAAATGGGRTTMLVLNSADDLDYLKLFKRTRYGDEFPILIRPEDVEDSKKRFEVFREKIYKCQDPGRIYINPEDFVYDYIPQLLNFITGKDEIVCNVAENLVNDCYTPIDAAQRVIDFVHCNFLSVLDGENFYTQSSLETLVKKTGNCEDLVILTASLMDAVKYQMREWGRRFDIEAGLIYLLSNKKSSNSHIAIGLCSPELSDFFRGRDSFIVEVDGQKKEFFYAETVGTTDLQNPAFWWEIGILSDDFKTGNYCAYVVKGHDICRAEVNYRN
ncbi:hypothetical protein COT48_00110 [Candidatus Woesearchaeota archaeon CG08_land_8_20_14_0_20_47_9]|nr:MAG: hypothetical protein AUJ69_01335 [Candidatus Woesearchaeota archaeon CG1_02_47_18]PIN74683.1 MAG: hypothetical protein COV22_01065 [Candidatus Woesearchaeota archaeon CG10_big_fil_rev_8_21_14_0_10_47_5]PIO04503.1 MAG: hypothetical protein COT48_00110 [Candidatus Woesearchaeota archaeon CG08_land_8_20_14_0_20_47_9]